ncbi:hypothetical protein TYRP_013206 [Tyrophagus putrescentiae]|nr:hypothetical protein TYRP_013206 [Tyrophagus putrescentiae]
MGLKENKKNVVHGIEKLTTGELDLLEDADGSVLTGEGWWEQVDPAKLVDAKIDEEKKAKAFAFMVRHCSTAIVSDLALKGHNVSKCPRGMWTYLSNRFEKMASRRGEVHSEYEKGIQVARMAGINLNDEIIYLRFVHQICDELEATRNRLQEKDDFEEAKEILRAETKRFLEKEKSETALKAAISGGRQNGSKVPYCGKCGIKGHWLMKDCNPQATSASVVVKTPHHEYYLDSGASDHFVNEPSAFTGLRQMHSTVTTAEGKKSLITGVGDVALKNVVLRKQNLYLS